MNTAAAPFRSGTFRVTSPFGERPALGDYHRGIDLVGMNGDTEVTAVADGLVIRSRIVTDKSNSTWEWGNYVTVLQHDGRYAYYCHLKSRAVKDGETVHAGQKIGVMGNTGKSYGAHLHFEVRHNMESINAAEYLGIPNISGAVITAPPKTPDYADLVCQKCGLEDKTRKYIDAYRYAEDLWRKLYEQMR